jgi:hypothetical protein
MSLGFLSLSILLLDVAILTLADYPRIKRSLRVRKALPLLDAQPDWFAPMSAIHAILVRENSESMIRGASR